MDSVHTYIKEALLYLNTHYSAVIRRKHDPGLDMQIEHTKKNTNELGVQRIFALGTSFNYLFNKNVLKTYEKTNPLLGVKEKIIHDTL